MSFMARRVYLDYASGEVGNPSSAHEEGRHAKKALEGARTRLARLVEAKPDDVIFTSGATEANALAIIGHVRALRKAGKKDIHILYLPSAHASIVENMRILAEEGAQVDELPIRDARVDTDVLAKMLRKGTVLVSMDAVCGETGVVWNTREVAETLRKSHDGDGVPRALLHVDASQAPLTEKISRAHFGADVLTFDASKVGKTRGIGALIAHRTIPMTPFYRGGGQERGLRPGSGTPDLAESFVRSLEAAVAGRAAFRFAALRERVRVVEHITNAIPDVYIQEGRLQAPNILNLALPGRDTDYLLALLDEAGFAVSSRSACETDSEEGSRAVFALTGDRERARTTLRISWGPRTRPRDLMRFSRALAQAVAFIDTKESR